MIPGSFRHYFASPPAKGQNSPRRTCAIWHHPRCYAPFLVGDGVPVSCGLPETAPPVQMLGTATAATAATAAGAAGAVGATGAATAAGAAGAATAAGAVGCAGAGHQPGTSRITGIPWGILAICRYAGPVMVFQNLIFLPFRRATISGLRAHFRHFSDDSWKFPALLCLSPS